MKYELIDLQESYFKTDDFEHEIRLGDLEHYYILCDNKPYLKVGVDLKMPFDDAVIYNNHLLIGDSDKVYFVDLTDLESISKDEEFIVSMRGGETVISSKRNAEN